ncbi:AraC family transcriptional regulator [Pseudomonas rhodesiae]|uniref:AraC family transcriptional regulator n=1 Tax=Pseudomonas rhodesiae TaxID=76760 RepID=UPI001BD0F1DA|nr:AraC family transcriptional regulator [Pseudomonas rhodesiae]QVN04041.1 AraC family transcriptional regulator [Pseudomonas rhodesiae]
MHHSRPQIYSPDTLFEGMCIVNKHALAHEENETRLLLQSVHPGQIPATTHVIVLAVELARQRGLSVDAVLRDCHLPVEHLNSPSISVTREQELKVFENLLELSGDAAVGLEIGRRLHVSCFGLPGYTMLVSETVQDAINCMSTFPLLMGLYFTVTTREEGDRTAIVIDDYNYSKPLEPLCTDMLLAAIMAIVTDLVGHLIQPVDVSLQRCCPPQHDFCSDFFGCSVRYGATENAITFPTHLFHLPSPLANAVSVEALYQQCLDMERDWTARASRNLISQIRELLARDLGEFNTLGRAAEHFCLTERTLRRRLKSINISFQHLLDEARQKRAEKLLLDGIKIAEIAELLGYSDIASFRHAFRRWTGLSPSQYRQHRVS